MADLSKLDKVINELDSQSKEIVEINKMLSEIGTLNKGLSKNILTLEKHNSNFVAVTDALNASITETLVKLTTKVDELHAENKKFYKEIGALLHSLLEKHRSDIQVEVRNESQQLRKDIKEVQEITEKRLIAIEGGITETSERQAKSAGLLLKVALAILAINILLALKALGIF